MSATVENPPSQAVDVLVQELGECLVKIRARVAELEQSVSSPDCDPDDQNELQCLRGRLERAQAALRSTLHALKSLCGG